MNHTRLIPHASHALRWGALIFALAAAVFWFGGCADPRTEPLQQPSHGYTETVVLWQDQPSNGQIIETTFEVKDPLAEITDPINDTPARLKVWAYIRPDAEIVWREAIMSDSIPTLSDAMLPYFIQISQAEGALDSLNFLDSLCTANPDTCTQLGIDPAVVAANIAQLQTDTASFHASLAVLVADTTQLGMTRDSLGMVLDNRYTLTLWFDADTLATLPEAVYVNVEHLLAGQEIYLAATDTSRGYKGRLFDLDLNNFQAADPDPDYIGLTRQINWTTCYAGSDRPCMSEGTHTLRALVTGTDTKVTATLVLTYAENTP